MSAYKGYLRDNQGNQFASELLIQSGFWIIQYKDKEGHRQQIAWNDKHVTNNKDSFDSYRYEDKNHNQFYFTSSDSSLAKRMNSQNPIQKWIDNNPAFPSVAFISIIILLTGIGIWKSMPYLNDKITNSISIETEQKLGDKMASAMLESESINDTLTQIVNGYYKALDKSSKYNIKITVVNSDMVNAYALPGGNIVVFTEILKKMKSHEALAALLGHESTHIEHRHSLKSLTRNLAFTALIGILFGGHDLTSVLAANASKFSGLKYSRTLEEDADQGSIAMMNEKKISIQGMVDLMTALNETDSSGLHLEFIQSHPLTEKRMEVANKAMDEQKDVIKNVKLIEIWGKIEGQLNR